MIETDAPYLLPRDLPIEMIEKLHDRRNEPSVLPHICEALAQYKNEDPQKVAIETTRLARQFFELPDNTSR